MNAALGRVVASVPEATVMDVYNSVSATTDPGVPTYMKSLVNGADAVKASSAFLEFKIASVPASKVMAVYNSFSGVVGSQIPNNMFALADPLAANAAAKAFYEFKDVVKASR